MCLEDDVNSIENDITLANSMGFLLRKILVIYTGGTIGMKWRKNKGFMPCPGYLFKELSTLSLVNDQNFIDQIFIRNEGAESPNDSRYFCPDIPYDPERSSLSPWLALPSPYETREEEINSSNENLSNDQRVIYRILEHIPLLDSSNLNMDNWFNIACDIENYYSYFDSFIILHGTDTLAYTSSALSFLLENLGKTVIFTGSQVFVEFYLLDSISRIKK